MQDQLYDTLEMFDQLDSLKDWEPFLRQLIDISFPEELSNCVNRNLLLSFFHKCLDQVQNDKVTISMQEDALQAAIDELLRLREEVAQLNQVNQSSLNKVDELKRFLDESESITLSLRGEIRRLKQEIQSSMGSNDHQTLMQKRELPPNVSLDRENLGLDKLTDITENKTSEHGSECNQANDMLQQYERIMRGLMQEVGELTVYKEKYEELHKESIAQQIIKEQNEKLQKQIAALTEENNNLKIKKSDDLLEQLKSWGSAEFKKKRPQLDPDIDWSPQNIEEEYQKSGHISCPNKSSLFKKSFSSIMSPSRDLDLKKHNLLETLLTSRLDRFSPARSNGDLSSGKKMPLLQPTKLPIELSAIPQSEHAGSMQFGGESELTKNSVRATCNSKIMDSNSFIRTSRTNRKKSIDRRDDEPVIRREPSIERNACNNLEDNCLELLSWEEGDFPHLGSLCNSPQIDEGGRDIKFKKLMRFNTRQSISELSNTGKGQLHPSPTEDDITDQMSQKDIEVLADNKENQDEMQKCIEVSEKEEEDSRQVQQQQFLKKIRESTQTKQTDKKYEERMVQTEDSVKLKHCQYTQTEETYMKVDRKTKIDLWDRSFGRALAFFSFSLIFFFWLGTTSHHNHLGHHVHHHEN